MVCRLKSLNRDQLGVTLTELLVVIVVISIIAGFALMQRGSANDQLKRQNVAQELKVAFERARFDSVKRRAQASPSPDVRAKVVVDTNFYALTTYPVNAAGTPSESTLSTSIAAQNIVIAGSNSVTLPFTIYYNQRGEAVDSAGLSISPAFFVCNVSCSSPANANANLIIVTPTGTVNLLPGGTAVPTFGVPTMTNVNRSTGINNDAVVP